MDTRDLGYAWNDDQRQAPVSTNAGKSFAASLGNGELGLQGSDSGLEAGRSFMAGVIDLTPNDLHRMAVLPSWNGIALRVPGGSTLAEAFAAGRHGHYRQQIDTATATLRTEYRIDLGGMAVRVETESWLSRADRHLGVVRCRLTADRDGILEAQVGVTANATVTRHPFRSVMWPHEDYPRAYGHGFFEKRMIYAWHPGHMDIVALGGSGGEAAWGAAAVAAHDGPAVGVAIALGGDAAEARDASDAGNARGVLTLRLSTGRTHELVLYAAFSRDDRPGTLLGKALASAQAARARGYHAARADHAAAWADLWRSEVRVEGDASLDRQARLDLFMLYQNAPVDQRFPLQITGLATPGYYGNVLWDVDCYSWRGLLPFAPELSQATPMFRRRTLDQALLHAGKTGHRGALYPWQACSYAGEDNCPLPIYNRAIHMTLEVAQTMWLQWCALGDRAFLRRDAWPVISAVADYACSRVVWVPWAGRYEYKEVMGVEEAHGLVDNELHTAAMTVLVLRLAIRTAEILGLGANPLWSTVAERMHLPKNQRTGFWQAHSAIDHPTPRRWTETTAYHLAELPASEAQLRDALKPIAEVDGKEVEDNLPWNLSFHAMAAARLGDEAAFALILRRQSSIRVDPDIFGLRCEIPGNDAGPYLTGCGSFLQGLLHGGTGLAWGENGLAPRHAPCLPTGVEGITFTKLRWHGRDHAVRVDRGHGLVVAPLS